MKAKTYQKPKADHPWRQYADRVRRIEDIEIEIEIEGVLPLKSYLQQVVNNWDEIEVTTTLPEMGVRVYTLNQVPQATAAAYIIGVLKRVYVQRNKV